MNILTKHTLDKGNTPKDILMIRRLIENEEFLNTYTLDILSESKQFANLSDRGKINIEDVKLAVKLKQQHMYSKKPDISKLYQMARETNNIRLPHIPENPHILLPPPEHSLIRNNFQVFSEDLANILNNPNYEQEEKNKLEDLELNSNHNKGKSRQSIIGIKRHTDRTAERLSLTSNFKKRKTDIDELNENFDNNKNNVNNNNFINKNIKNENKLLSQYKQGNDSNDFYSEEQNKIKNNKNNNYNEINNKNKQRYENETNQNEDDYKSENNEMNNDDYNNEERDGDEYDQMENQSENSEGNFGYRDDFNHSVWDNNYNFK